jgi:hypothetical protein
MTTCVVQAASGADAKVAAAAARVEAADRALADLREKRDTASEWSL